MAAPDIFLDKIAWICGSVARIREAAGFVRPVGVASRAKELHHDSR
jgi:hypothetical protein